MKKHKIDQLFAEKLKNHKTPPSDKLWETLDEELGEPAGKRMGMWWKAAAVILLCLSAGLWVYQASNDDERLVTQEGQTIEAPGQAPQNDTKAEATESTRQKAVTAPSVSEKEDTPLLAEEKTTPPSENIEEKQPAQPMPAPVRTEAARTETLVAEQPVQTIEKLEPVAGIATEKEATILENNDLPAEVTTVVAEVREPVKIIYKANTSKKEDKDSKFFEVVKDIKNGDLGLAELRDAKSELIASAFSKLKDKKEKQ